MATPITWENLTCSQLGYRDQVAISKKTMYDELGRKRRRRHCSGTHAGIINTTGIVPEGYTVGEPGYRDLSLDYHFEPATLVIANLADNNMTTTTGKSSVIF